MRFGSRGYRIVIHRPLVRAIVEEASTPLEALEKYRAAAQTFGRCDLVLEEIGVGVIEAADVDHVLSAADSSLRNASPCNASAIPCVQARHGVERTVMNRLRKGCPTVLVVEDEILERLSLADFLRQSGCSVIEAHDAHEATQLLHAGRQIDFLFADMRLPGEMDGVGLARWMRAYHPAVPVVLTSGHHAGLAAAADLCAHGSVVPKPYVLTEVARTIRALLADPTVAHHGAGLAQPSTAVV